MQWRRDFCGCLIFLGFETCQQYVNTSEDNYLSSQTTSMSAFNYSKWDNIELSDDESDCHPNIEKESWFRMKHRSRVEREENEEADKKRIGELLKANDIRLKDISRTLTKIVSSDDGDDELEDVDGMKSEAEEIYRRKAEMEAKLASYEKNKKWNVDNLSTVVDEKTIINSANPEKEFTADGYAVPTTKDAVIEEKKPDKKSSSSSSSSSTDRDKDKKSTTAMAKPVSGPKPSHPPSETEATLSYGEFVDR